jgi:succinate dehydrogenase / fumarate reductase, cytochrome b subunit
VETGGKKILKEAFMQVKAEHHPNRLGVAGWFWGGNYKLERYLYIIHRITALGMLLFFGFHLIETTFFRIQGQSAWQMTMGLLKQPAFEVGLILVSLAFAIHAINGLRLILMELGFGLGAPRRPVYPFRDSLRRNRGYTLLTIGVIVILMILFLINWIIGRAV